MNKKYLALDNRNQTLELSLDPRVPIEPLPMDDIRSWLENDVEEIDLGTPRRDEVIQPTTWAV